MLANGDILILLEFFPFMLSPSKHSEPFFSSLLVDLKFRNSNRVPKTHLTNRFGYF